jgi:hypothetical protein
MPATSDKPGFFRDKQGKIHPLRLSGDDGKSVDRFGESDTLQNNPKPKIQGRIRAIAQKYLKDAGFAPIRNFQPQTLQPAEGRGIADAYASAKDNPNDPETKEAYGALNKEIGDQWNALVKGGIQMEPWTKSGQPYQTSTEMKKDVDQNGHLWYFRTTGDTDNHPNSLMTNEQNDKFRAVHDVFGHAQMGNQFGPVGETNAYLEHSQMFSPKALRALTTETLGQNATYNFGKDNVGKPAEQRNFAVQKATLLPQSTYSGLMSRRDSAMMSAHEPEDYFGCPQHRSRPTRMGALKMAVQAYFKDKQGRVHPISSDHSPAGVPSVTHESEGMLIKQLKDNGGFTFHAQTGEQPTKGYSVSPFQDREAIFPGTDVRPSDLHNYVAKNQDLLSKPDHYLGGWHDKEHGNTAIDVSIIKPTKDSAEMTGRDHKQKAYFDLEKGEDVPIDYGPGQTRYRVYKRHPHPDYQNRLESLTQPDTYPGAKDYWSRMNFDSDLRGRLVVQPDAGKETELQPDNPEYRPDESSRMLSIMHEEASRLHQKNIQAAVDRGKTSLSAQLLEAIIEFAGPPPGRLMHEGSGGDKPKFFTDPQGNVRPMGGGWQQGGSGKAIDPYPVKPTAKMQANADAAFAEMGLTPENLRATFEKSYGQSSDKERESGHNWYPRTHDIAGALAKRGNMPLSNAAGAIAALSPHNEFIRNLKGAKVAIDVVNGRFRGRETARGPKKKIPNLATRAKMHPDAIQAERLKYMRDKPITELTISPAAAQRMYDSDSKSKMKARAAHPLDVRNYNGIEEAHHGKNFTGTHRVQDLPGDVLAAFIPKLGGQRNMFATAMTIARGGDPDKYLGAAGSNKVRSFYNNILDPEHDPYNSTTVDTHIIMEGRGKGRGGYGGSWLGTGQGSPGSAGVIEEDKKVGKVFGNPALYKKFDDAIKDVSANHGLRSHQGQAVMWNVHKNRGLETQGDQAERGDRVRYAAYTGEDELLGPEDISSNPDTWDDDEYETIRQEDEATQRIAQEEFDRNEEAKSSGTTPKDKPTHQKEFHQAAKDDLKKGPIRKALESAVKAMNG